MLVAPQIAPFSLSEKPANSGDMVSVTCTVTVGDQPLTFEWFFNGQPLIASTENDIMISTKRRRSLLEIDGVKANHSGEYSCTVSNEAGATSHVTRLIVNGTTWRRSHATFPLYLFSWIFIFEISELGFVFFSVKSRAADRSFHSGRQTGQFWWIGVGHVFSKRRRSASGVRLVLQWQRHRTNQY